MVVGHVSRPYVEPVHCRRPRFPDCRCASLEHCRRMLVHPVLYQLSSVAQDRALLTKLSDCVNF